MSNDLLKLNASSNFNLENNNEANINLNLTTPTITSLGSVSGTIYDTTLLTGNVVPGATIKVFTADGTPYAHTVSGTDGKYTISDLPIGIYTIAAVKEGTYLSPTLPLTISSIVPVTINLALLNNISATKNIIYGTILDSTTNLPIENINVSLYKVVDDTKTLQATTTTIADGEYILDQIEDGTYELAFNKSGYQTAEFNNIELNNEAKFDASTTLTSAVGTINNTVSGVIKNELGIIVANAFVGLYKILNGTETLVAVTYTNAEGKYLFGNVLDGEYIVKSKLSATL